MAFNLSNLNFFSKLDARTRVVVLLGGVIGTIFLVYFGVNYFSDNSGSVGPSRVANAPANLQSVPGATTSAEYQRALLEANQQAAQQAQMSGSSAIPTMVNFGGGQQGSCVICSDQSADVKNMLDDWVRKGKLSPEVSTALQKLAEQNVTVGEYASQLDELVKQGKITPDQARALLEEYKKQHNNSMLSESEKAIDALIKEGKVPLDVANQLLMLQKKGASPTAYAEELQRLVKEGKLSPEAAQKLLAQYTQVVSKEVIQTSIASIRQLAREGKVIPEVEKALVQLELDTVPLEQYSATLQQFVDAGKLTPAVAGQILDEFKSQKAAIGPTGSINQMIQKAEADAFTEIAELKAAGKMSTEVGGILTDMINKNIPFDDFTKAVNQLVQTGKLSLEISKLKIADYKRVKGLRDMSEKLTNLQANNASPDSYFEELKRQVKAGAITPEEASRLLQEYTAATTKGSGTTSSDAATSEFAQLQKNVAAGESQQTTPAASEFETATVQETEQAVVDRKAQIDSIIAAMSGQAGQLVAAWQPPSMASQGGVVDTTDKTAQKPAAGEATSSGVTGTAAAAALAPVLIKAGSIAFAVLDTAVNSDYPDSPVMATVVDGPYKGAKLLGKLTVTKGVSGQLDRVSLTFTLMNLDAWPKGKTVTAYAIDPDTARTVMASEVDYHYLQRFGAIMATSFVQGYANAITSSAATTTTGIFGTSTTNPALSPSQKLATAIGQIGTALGTVTQNYVNIPPTVKVDSGVGLGILFMADVT